VKQLPKGQNNKMIKQLEIGSPSQQLEGGSSIRDSSIPVLSNDQVNHMPEKTDSSNTSSLEDSISNKSEG